MPSSREAHDRRALWYGFAASLCDPKQSLEAVERTWDTWREVADAEDAREDQQKTAYIATIDRPHEERAQAYAAFQAEHEPLWKAWRRAGSHERVGAAYAYAAKLMPPPSLREMLPEVYTVLAPKLRHDGDGNADEGAPAPTAWERPEDGTDGDASKVSK